MDTFRTEIQVKSATRKIKLDTPILGIGSCFAGIIGQKLISNKFNALVNPFGTLFNPIAVINNLHNAWEGVSPPENHYLTREGWFFHYDFHSGFAAPEKEELSQYLNQALQKTRDHLQKTQWLIITMGTAFIYQRKEDGSIVANCHKMPQKLFEKRRLSVEEIKSEFSHFFRKLLKFNPDLQCILTVSPVRHLRDTLKENGASKATLRLACEELQEAFPGNISYFPAYEILIDDLRDYRFYSDDMIHPGKLAEDYVWNKFIETYCDQESIQFIKAWEQILKALEHRPFHPESEAHQQFVKNTIEKIKQWEPKVDVSEELERMKKQLL